MRIKRFSGALSISVVCHIVIVIIAGFHLGTQDRQFKELLGTEFVLFPEGPKPKVRKPVIGSVIKSNVPLQNPRLTQPQMLPKSTAFDISATVDASGVSPSADLSDIHVNVPNVPTANGIMFQRPPGLAMVQNVGAPRDQLEPVVENMVLGDVKRPKQHVRRGEPARAVIVTGKQLSSGEILQPLILQPLNGATYDEVFFKGSGTNPFVDTEDDAFSTFGMDVDTASYTVMRRYLRDGHLPPPEAVRVEEFVNAFDYNYTPPTDGAFAVHLEGAPSRFGEGKRLQLLRIGIQGRVIPDTDRKDAILTFVIDVSGSMRKENRLGLVKRALTLLVGQLRPEDKVGIVVYGTNARVVLPHTDIVNREHILTAIRALAPEGATNAEAGLRTGYKLALQNLESNSINRVILCSDGVANVGQTGSDEILKEIRTYVKEGVTLTTVGFGMGNYNDILMEQLANKGNGSYAYVDTLNEAKRVFVENLTGTLQVIAKDAKIQVEFNSETVSRFRLLGYENRRLAHEDFRNDTVDAGEVGAGHSVTALYEIKLHENANGKLATVSIRHENPDTGNVTEVNRSISTDVLKGSFEETTPTFQLAASVAEFAEILRGSFWAQDGSLEIVRETLERVLPHINAQTREHKARNEELLSLVRKAQRFKEQKAL